MSNDSNLAPSATAPSPERDLDTSLETWKSRRDKAKAVAGRHLLRTQRYVDGYCGFFESDWYRGEVNNNYVRKVIDTAVEHTLYRAPMVEILPAKGIDTRVNSAAATMINQTMGEAHAEQKLRTAVFHGYLYGHGYLKFGFNSEFPGKKALDLITMDSAPIIQKWVETGKIDPPKKGQDHKRLIVELQALIDSPQIIKNSIQQHGGLSPVIKLAAHIQERQRMMDNEKKKGRIDWRYEPNQVWCESVDPREMLFDNTATCWEDCRWVMHRIVKPVGDVKRDPALKNTANLEGAHVQPFMVMQGQAAQHDEQYMAEQFKVAGSKGNQPPGDDDPEEMCVELFDCWDRKTEKRFIFSDQADDFLYEGDSPYQDIPGFFPFVQVKFIDSPAAGEEAEAERVMGESLARRFWDEQVQLNTLIQVSLEISKHSVPRYNAATGIDPEFLKKMQDGQPGGVHQLPQTYKGDPRYAITQIPITGNTADMERRIAKLEDMCQFKAGFSGVQLLDQDSSKTATAGQIMASSASNVIDKFLGKIEEAYIQSCKIVRALIVQFYKQDRIVALTGDDGIEYVTATGSELAGSTWGQNIVVRVGSQGPAIDAMKLQRVSLLYNLLAKNPYLKLREFTKWMLSQAGLTRSPDFIFSDAEVEEQQKQAQMMAQASGGGAQNNPNGAGSPVDVNQARSDAAGAAAQGGQPPPGGPQPPQAQQPSIQ